MKTYPKMKETSISWLGDIPEYWEVKRLRFLCSFSTGDKDTVNRVEDGDYPFYVRSPIIERINSYSFDGEAILMAGDGVGAGKVFHYANGKFDYHQRVYCFHDFKNVSAQYLIRYMSENFWKKIEEGGAKSTVDSVRLPMLSNFPIALPPLPEQQAIAAYLDKATAKIDALIAEQEKLCTLLAEKRKALISHVVTKGLDPKAKLEDSGVSWLGKIPEHWRTDRLRRTCTRVTDGAHISPDLSSADFPFVSTVDVGDGKINFDSCLKTTADCYFYLVHTGCKPYVGDVLFSKDGTVGRTAVVNMHSDFVVASSLVIISPIASKLNSRFLDYWLNNSLLQQDVALQLSGAALRRISVEKIGRLPVVLPPMIEQAAIAEYLDMATAKLDALAAKAEEGIALLKERRSALISEVVTGKVRVA